MPWPNPAPRIGELRHPLTVLTRRQAPDPNSTGIVDAFANGQPVHGKVESLTDQTFYADAQIETNPTHLITLRWLDYIDTTCVILRRTELRDGGARLERFRVRRVMELDDRKRFIRLACELETIEE